MTDPLDPAAELAKLARAVWRADHDGADVPDDQVPGFEALARALDRPYMEDARVDAVARLDELYRELEGREPEDVANDPGWHAAFRASIDAVYRDGCGREPPDDPDERAEATGEVVIAGRILALASTALRCADPPVSQHGHPLAPLVRSWHRRPISADPVRRVDRILPGSVAMIDSTDRRSGRLFSPATHREGQQALPGFEDKRHGPALPLALYHLGNENPDRGGSRGAPLALRLFVEAVLCVPMDRRAGLRPVEMSVTLRELRDRLYPDSRLSTTQVLRALTRAADALDTRDARIPWEDPATGRGGLRRVVSVLDLPRGEAYLDDVLTLFVNLPPGTGAGPVVPETLATWGLRSAPAYNLIINLSYRLFDPGRTRYPVNGRHWMPKQDPQAYEPISVDEIADDAFPLSTNRNRRDLRQRALKALEALHAAREFHIEQVSHTEYRVMPALPSPREDANS